MAEDKKDKKAGITSFVKPLRGMNTDAEPSQQPEGSYRYAKNAVYESEDGTQQGITTEQGHLSCANIPEDYIIIGKVKIDNNNTALFLCKNDNSLSEIGILEDNRRYVTHVNANLGFKTTHQIDAVYRLRRGCERTVYFVDGIKNRIYNFDKPYNFTKENSTAWDPDKFSLIKNSEYIPLIDKVEITQDGSLLPGSYIAGIRYLDEDLNPTEVLVSSESVIIYNDKENKSFGEIEGSTNEKTLFQNFGNTGKAIRFNFKNLDNSFPFYQVLIAEATTGLGVINRVLYSQEIPTEIDHYLYTGNNGVQEGVIEDFKEFTQTLEAAEHIEILNNTLVLANTSGIDINLKILQQTASRITSDLKVKDIILNDIKQKNNHKRPTVHFEDMHYQPGEIYSFGIVYVFLINGKLHKSPVFHIPGKAPSFSSKMSNDNTIDAVYTDNSACDSNMWGVDSQGNVLLNKPIRHHRFPLRSELDIPLFEKDSEVTGILINTLKIKITGAFNEDYANDSVNVIVTYKEGDIEQTEQFTVTKDTYNSEIGKIYTITNSYKNFEVISIQEINDENETVEPFSGLEYNSVINSNTKNYEDYILKSKIFGIEFNNIEIPTPDQTGGHKIIGYYIVRNERTENEKTILDTGVLTPLVEETGDKSGKVRFIAHGHLAPKTTRLKEDCFALIHPQHKFRDREYTYTSELIQEGEYIVDSRRYARSETQDVQAGTSYDPEIHKNKSSDDDGYTLRNLIRTNNLSFEPIDRIFANKDEIEEIFYLDTLFSNSVKLTDGETKDIYNISADNKIGIVVLNKKEQVTNRLPYVVMKRKNSSSYQNFRLLPYHMESKGIVYAKPGEISSTTVFNGDCYISPMKYTSSMFYDVKMKKRSTKNGIVHFIAGIISIIAGIIAVPFTGGASLALIGFGVTQLATGLKKEQMAKVYKDLYEAGLKETVEDEDTAQLMDIRQELFDFVKEEGEIKEPENNIWNPEGPLGDVSVPRILGTDQTDDEIRWFFDILNDLWFESQINTNWRAGSTVGLTDFMHPVSEYNEEQTTQYAIDKVTNIDAEANDGRTYQGYAKAEIYSLNKDYQIRNNVKNFYALGLEYDFCSKCKEEFPHRYHWSQQSFQEELTDNFRVFLPNNYKDLAGETGVITDLFTMKDQIFIHTEEALWAQPKNMQERVTGDIVSFVGTGGLFEIPARMILDSGNGMSAGTRHKWGTIKTPFGVIFISEHQGQIFVFNGQALQPISNKGLSNDLKQIVPLRQKQDYYNNTGRLYELDNNPSNSQGIGFISGYDSRKERILITKKDFIIVDDRINSDDYVLCPYDNTIVFNDFSKIIDEKALDGWEYIGIENCEMIFEKQIQEAKKVTVVAEVSMPNDADIIVQLDVSGSFTSSTREQIKSAVINWKNNFASLNTDWEGNLYFLVQDDENWRISERSWKTLELILDGNNIYDTLGNLINPDIISKNIIAISFVNENTGEGTNGYHPAEMGSYIPGVTEQFEEDVNIFKNLYERHIAKGGTFNALIYPIVFKNNGDTQAYLQHVMAAIKGRPWNNSEIQILEQNPIVDWDKLTTSLMGINPYDDDGLENYGWKGIYNRYWDQESDIITSQQFQDDMYDFLGAVTYEGSEEVIKYFPKTITTSHQGEVFEDLNILKTDWTLSYNIKQQAWCSYHSYLPNIYVTIPEKIFSWDSGNTDIYEHNIEGLYLNYRNKVEEFVVEVVHTKSLGVTKDWDFITFNTIAKDYNERYDNYNEENFVTFNKFLAYNRKQTTGLLYLKVKDVIDMDENYMSSQVQDDGGNVITLDRHEEDWSLNELRNYRINYTKPMFSKAFKERNHDYFTDKTLNNVVDYNKSWQQLENLKGKFLIARYIFDNNDKVRLTFNYTLGNEVVSIK